MSNWYNGWVVNNNINRIEGWGVAEGALRRLKPYCMSKKSWPILYCKLSYKMDQTSWTYSNIILSLTLPQCYLWKSTFYSSKNCQLYKIIITRKTVPRSSISYIFLPFCLYLSFREGVLLERNFALTFATYTSVSIPLSLLAWKPQESFDFDT